MFRNRLGFTLIELLVVITLIGISLTLAAPSWEQVSQKRRVTNATEQVAAFLSVAQSEAQKQNQHVSLSFNRSGDQNWCIGTVLALDACDCTETDPASEQYCAIDGAPKRIEANSFQFIHLIEATDSQPTGGDSRITFDPIRGILQPAGDKLQLTFESANGDFKLRLSITPTGLLSICSPDDGQSIGGYLTCAG